MATLNRGFEDDLREAMLDNAESTLVGEFDPLVFRFVERAHEILRAYGQRNGYDVEPVIESLGQPDVQRNRNSITATIGWEHPAAPYFQMGTSDHTIDGTPVLSFIWEDAPEGVREMFPETERVDGDPRVFFESVDVQGLPESRFVRDAIAWLRREVQR
jgi:hypothetical protein